MNPQAQIMAKQALLSVLALVCLAACPSWAIADQPSVNPTSMSFAAGGTIRMELNKGTMEVVGVADDKITVSWHSRSLEDERDVTVKLQRSGEKNATIAVDGPGNRMRYHIEVPVIERAERFVSRAIPDLEPPTFSWRYLIRVSTWWYNTEEEVDRLANALSELLL